MLSGGDKAFGPRAGNAIGLGKHCLVLIGAGFQRLRQNPAPQGLAAKGLLAARVSRGFRRQGSVRFRAGWRREGWTG